MERRKDITNTLFVLLCMIGLARGNRYPSSYPVWSEMACQEYPLMLRCPGTDVIQIVTAEYGRQSKEKCSALASQMKNINCALPEAPDILANLCNNKTQCSLTVSSDIFPDPCPGTHKYLNAMFNCVKYLFGCPGWLVGIGSEEVTAVDIQPQLGTWVKDPLYDTDHVYFIPFGTRQAQKVHEYESWDDFTTGNLANTYNLRSNIAQGNVVVYDRILYFIKANTRSLVKYNLLTRFQIKRAEIPGTMLPGSNTGSDIRLSVDENGVWVTYASKGNMVIIKLDKDELSILNTWNTNYNIRNSLHTFVICGVVYVVSSTSGTVDYAYNTNLDRDNENRALHIAFDAERSPGFGFIRARGQSGRSRRGGRSFLRYNSTSISYNPRDRLIYLWDSTEGNAVVYKLHFDGQDPSKVNVKTTSSSTTMSTSRRTLPRTTLRPTQPEIEPPKLDEELGHVVPNIVGIDLDFCPHTVRSDLQWPRTRAGDIATVSCLDDSGATATWTCVRDSSMREAAWHIVGPDTSKCSIWVSDIEMDFDLESINRAEAFEKLASGMDQGPLTDTAIQVTSRLMKKLVDASSTPSKYEAERIVKSITAVSSDLFKDDNEEAWESMSDTKRAEIANTLMTSVEKAGFLYADTVAATPSDSRGNEPLIVASDDILMQVEVRDRAFTVSTSSVTSFPGSNSRWNGVSDVIEISDTAIMNQKGEGPATVVFILYDSIGDFLSPPPEKSEVPIMAAETEGEESPRTDEWGIDTRVISASFRDATYKTQLSSPASIVFSHRQESTLPRRCVYWDYSESTGTGNWSDAGCRRIGGNSTHTKCECDHLTSFAVLVNHAGVSAEEIHHETALDIVTSIGISISIVCLVICIFTFSCFRNLRSDRNTIHKHLCICLLVAETIFLIGINQTQHKIACAVIAGILHYSFLAAFLWMALEGFQLYVMLVEVFEGRSRWKWYYLTGYGIPAVIVGVSAGVDHTGYGTDDVCWLKVDSGFIWSFVGPVCVVILANLVFLSITVYKMYVHTMTFSDSAKINSIKAAVRGASVLLCLLGITWAFGILWISEQMTVLAYLFCVFNAFQGMFIFIFHCLLPRKVRQEYSRCFSRLPCCQNLSRDTYVSNSMSFSKQYTPGRYANGTNGAGNQQASLSRQSQLRRMWNETVAHGPKNSDSTPITSEVQNRESSRPGSCSHRVAAQQQPISGGNDRVQQEQTTPPTLPAKQQQLRQEDDVFLPPEPFPEARQQQTLNSKPETVALLPNEQQHPDDIQYDHLQHHHHPGHYHAQAPFHPENYPAHHFQHNGVKLPPAPRIHSSTVAHSHSGHVHVHPANFTPASFSQSRIHDMLEEQTLPPRFAERRFEGHVPVSYWSESPSGHHYQGSFEDALTNAKRDSGISMQHAPPGSMVHQLANEMHRNKLRRSQENLTDAQPDSEGSNRVSGSFIASSRRFSHPARSPDSGEESGPQNYQPHHRNQRHEPPFSDSKGQPTYEDREIEQGHIMSHTIAGRLGHDPHCVNHNPMIIPMSERQGKAVTLANGHRRRKSLSSDSDDPIVTDCSVSSTGSSFGNPLTSLNRVNHRQDNISEEPYFEEKAYHKRRLPDPAQCVENHREQWYPSKAESKHGKVAETRIEDENDLEVEMITAPESGVENSRGSSSIASSYQNQHGSSTPPSSTGHSPEDNRQGDDKFISPPAGYRSGKSYVPVGGSRDSAPHMAYYNRTGPAENRRSPINQDYNKSPYRYIPNQNSRENAATGNRGEEIDVGGGLRMMTNL